MKKLFYSGLTALTMLFAMMGFVKAENTHTVTFDPVQGSVVKAGTAIKVTVRPTATEVLFKVFASREAAEAEAPSVMWDPVDGTADGTPKVTVDEPVLAVAVKTEGNAYEVFYAEYIVVEDEDLPRLSFPELAKDEWGQYLYGRYNPFRVELMYKGEKQTNFELYYRLEGNSEPKKESYNPNIDPGVTADVDPADAQAAIRKSVGANGYAEIMIENGMAPYFKALAYFYVEGSDAEIKSELFSGTLQAVEVATPSWSTLDREVAVNTVVKIRDNEPGGGSTIFYSNDGETMPLMSLWEKNDPHVFKYDSNQGIKITEDVVLWAMAFKEKDGVMSGSERLRNGKFTVLKPIVKVELDTTVYTIGEDAPVVTVTMPEGFTLGTEAGDVALELYVYNENPLTGWTQVITQSGTALDMSKAIENSHEDVWFINCRLVKGDDPTKAFEGFVTVAPQMLEIRIEKKGEKPAAPQFSLPSGPVERGSMLAITCATEGAEIYYTFGDGEINIPYTQEIAITVDSTIRAMAVKDGITSDVSVATYTIRKDPLPTIDVTLTPAPGEIVAGTEIEIEVSENVAFICYKLYPTIDSANNDDAPILNTGSLYPADGKPVPTLENPVLRVGVYRGTVERKWYYFNYTYQIKKDLSMPVITPAGGAVAMGTEVEIKHAEGVQGAKLYYTLNDSVPEVGKDYTQEYTQKIRITEAVTIKAMAFKAKTGDNDRDSVSNITEATFTLLPLDTVEAPTFSVFFDEVEKGTKVSLACATPDAKIYYTLDGEEPTEESTLYSEAIEINEDVTIKAIATKEYMANSKVSVKAYTVKPVANEGDELAGVSIYPNPNEGEFSVSVPVDAEVEVFAANGVLVKRVGVIAGSNPLRLENSGIYFVRVRANGQVAIKKVVVR